MPELSPAAVSPEPKDESRSRTYRDTLVASGVTPPIAAYLLERLMAIEAKEAAEAVPQFEGLAAKPKVSAVASGKKDENTQTSKKQTTERTYPDPQTLAQMVRGGEAGLLNFLQTIGAVSQEAPVSPQSGPDQPHPTQTPYT